MAFTDTPPVPPTAEPKGLGSWAPKVQDVKRNLAPKRLARKGKRSFTHVKINRPAAHNGVKMNAGFTALGGALDYSDARKHGLNRKQSATVAGADAPVGFATWHAMGHMRVKDQNAAHTAGMNALKAKHPKAAKATNIKALSRSSDAGKLYRNTIRGPLTKGVAKRAGVMAVGTYASSKLVKGLEHHFQQKNTRAVDNHPDIGGSF